MWWRLRNPHLGRDMMAHGVAGGFEVSDLEMPYISFAVIFSCLWSDYQYRLYSYFAPALHHTATTRKISWFPNAACFKETPVRNKSEQLFCLRIEWSFLVVHRPIFLSEYLTLSNFLIASLVSRAEVTYYTLPLLCSKQRSRKRLQAFLTTNILIQQSEPCTRFRSRYFAGRTWHIIRWLPWRKKVSAKVFGQVPSLLNLPVQYKWGRKTLDRTDVRHLKIYSSDSDLCFGQSDKNGN